MRVRHRLLAILMATTLATSLLLGFGAFRLLRAAVEERSTERMRAEASLLAEMVRTADAATDFSSLAADAGRRLGLRATLIDADGRVVGDSARERENLGSVTNHALRPEIVAAAASGEGIARRLSDTTGLGYVYVARRVDGDGPVRFVRLALPATELREIESRFFWTLVGFTLVVLLVLSAVVTLVVRRVARPIERMSEAAARMADGELTLEVSYDEDDEVGRLGAAMNRLKRSLVAKISEMGEEQSRLRSATPPWRATSTWHCWKAGRSRRRSSARPTRGGRSSCTSLPCRPRGVPAARSSCSSTSRARRRSRTSGVTSSPTSRTSCARR
jgi:two-component system phosphate regulon sensor histidine kinase PhoR